MTPRELPVVFVLLSLTLIQLTQSVSNRYEVARFEPGPVFNHLAWNKRTQELFVGAVNYIYKLDQFLVKDQEYATGPKLDNPNCPPLSNVPDSCSRVDTDAVNKMLVIDYMNERLIACFNLYHGYCEKIHIDNINKKEDMFHKPIVSNTINGSSFGFIAPGPSDNSGKPQPEVLYVSASWSTQGLKVYRDEIPAFCSRNLDNFRLVYKNFRKSSVEIESQQRDTFPVRYIYGFGSGKFSYMLTVQKKGAQLENFISKIFRVCQNDPKFYSYAEVELKCLHQQTHYNILQAAYVGKAGKNLAQGLGIPTVEDVLYAVFSLGESNSDTALCIYPLRKVHQMFTKNIQKCFGGIGNTGPDHVIAPARCVKANFNITDDYCGEHDINNPIDGTEPIQANAALRFGSHTNVSAITVAITHDYTVAFLGTTKGHMIKVTIEGREEASVYENVTVQEGSSINSDLQMDDKKHHLYVMTEKRLTKLKVQDCQQFRTCGECLGAKDPYCGWCSLENKCSLKEECNQHDMTMRWLPYSGQQCTNITRVIPDKIQKDHTSKTHTLELLIQNLPDFPGTYECEFSYKDMSFVPIITKANKTTKNAKPVGVSCHTPLPNQLPMVPTGQDHIVMRLSVRMNQQDFVSTDFTFFDCGLHNSCTSCTQSAFPCTWCVRSHICTHRTSEGCRRNETLVTGKAVLGTSTKVGPKMCPRIEVMKNNNSPQILVPANTELEVKVRGLHLEPYQTDNGGKSNLKCVFNFRSGQEVPARVEQTSDGHLIRCSPVRFDYIEKVSYQNVPFNIQWGDLNALDNPSNIQVTMYKCQEMAGSCGSCLTQDEKFLCGWCQDNDQCTTQRECLALYTDWLPHSSTCRNPLISSFSPMSGPLEGGTILTIHGQNLGKRKNDLNVSIGNIMCKILDYKAPQKITCETGRASGGLSKKVQVQIAGQYVATSSDPFSYVEPRVTDIEPKFGPNSGGTWVTISGRHMDAGTNKQVFIKAKECKVLPGPSTPDYIVCETSPMVVDPSPSVPSPTSDIPYDQVIVKFDKHTIQVPHKITFTYVPDPDVESIIPKHAIRSGGLRVTVRGRHFTNVMKPRMLLIYNNEEFDGSCMAGTDNDMICYTPMVDAVNDELNDPVQVSYGFKMDGVQQVMNLTGRNEEKYGVFTLYPDPIFEKFEGGVRSHQKKTEFLTINGRNLNPAIRQEDVRVSIGTGACNVTSIATTQLTCRPPKSQPKPKKGNGNPEVEVIVGQNLTFTIGSLKYEEPEMLTLPTIIGIAVGAGVLLFIVIIVIIAYQVKSRRSNDMMKKMRIQMDSLEARVANECKEAFAELQTDMTELTSDLYGQVSIPFWDYRTYCMKVLFPGVENHAVIKELQIGYRRNQEDVERGLQHFFHLISNKTFLLIFIRTLESSKNFQLRDRVNVASLITVALQTKMEYGTDILKTLLADLIEKSVEGKNHPKLLLRRNESVAEKMLTNWFSFLLYKFLRECAGEPLFMLYQAIKQQVSKGPVDSVTSEARYSLSEDKLIRQQLQYKAMTLNVLDMDSFTEQKQTHIVKVLDCDTISQVKEKILDAMYKNAPFSSRPAKEDLDLVLFGHPPEWLCHEKSPRQLILNDEDMSSKTETDCKRLNTLNHYQVPDGAYVAIVPKQDSVYNSSIISDKSNKFDQMPFNRSPPMNRTVISPQSVTVDFDNNGVKYYHLVRHHDTDPQREGDRGSKMVTEIYLPRLLVTKGTLQQFVDDLFERIFSTAHRGSALPLAIKYMFDFLDDQALLHNIQEPETVHTWKSNSLPLRFWVNVIKNPNFVFDIYKSPIVDSCLTVVGQTFMDSCSVSEHRLGKDSPSSKLLYAKDIPKYKKWVERYYQDIKMMPAISDQDMTAMLTEESRLHQGEFNTNAALMELYKYVQKYYEEISYALDEDEFARRNKLCGKLEQVQQAMDGDAVC